MSETHLLHRQPYCRRTPDDWVEIERLYRLGATAKSLAQVFGGTERSIYSRASKYGWLRRDLTADDGEGLTTEDVETIVRSLRNDSDAACRALDPDAPLMVAARAAAQAAVGMLRDGHVGRAQTYTRVAGMLRRLEAIGDPSEADDAAEDQAVRAAALDFLRARLGVGDAAAGGDDGG